MVIADMETTHLMNAIAFHRRQLETLRSLVEEFEGKRKKNLVKRVQLLSAKTHELEQELADRDPEDDDDQIEQRHAALYSSRY